MKSNLDSKTLLSAVARFGIAAETYLKNQGFGEKTILAAVFREKNRNLLQISGATSNRTWQLTDAGWSRLRSLYKMG